MKYSNKKICCLSFLTAIALFLVPANAFSDALRSATICQSNNYHGGVQSSYLSEETLHIRCVYPAYQNQPVQLWVSIGMNFDADSTYPDGVTSDSCLAQNSMTLLDTQTAHTQNYQEYWFSVPVQDIPSGQRIAFECARPHATSTGTYFMKSNTIAAIVIR